MNNIKKMILGFAAVAMIVSFSAFKSSENKLAPGQFRFYNISGVKDDATPSNFVYQDNSTSECTLDPDQECTALWTVDLPVGITQPSPGDNPNDFSSYDYDGGTTLGESNQ